MAVIAKSYTGGTTAATAMVTVPATLKALTINAAANAVVTLYDNASAASGTIVFQKNFTAATMYQLPLNTDGVRLSNGATIVVATATAQTTLYVD